MSDDASHYLYNHFKKSYEHRNQIFGNAGFATNIIYEAMKNTDYRIARIPEEERTEEKMFTVTVEVISKI